MALSFREKLERLEQMAEVAERLRLRGGVRCIVIGEATGRSWSMH
jgi:hypothetical protein